MKVIKHGLLIPDKVSNYEEFVQSIRQSEKSLLNISALTIIVWILLKKDSFEFYKKVKHHIIVLRKANIFY